MPGDGKKKGQMVKRAKNTILRLAEIFSINAIFGVVLLIQIQNAIINNTKWPNNNNNNNESLSTEIWAQPD
jgi:hypothetical protein